jgi:hypothetical protein
MKSAIWKGWVFGGFSADSQGRGARDAAGVGACNWVTAEPLPGAQSQVKREPSPSREAVHSAWPPVNLDHFRGQKALAATFCAEARRCGDHNTRLVAEAYQRSNGFKKRKALMEKWTELLCE